MGGKERGVGGWGFFDRIIIIIIIFFLNVEGLGV